MANFWGATCAHLDEEFDAPDAVADHELCRAIVAGKMGLHPDAWGAHDLLTTTPPHHREPFVPPVGYPGDREVGWKPHTPKPASKRPKPTPRPAWHPHTPLGTWSEPPPTGHVQLTCDDCQVRYRLTMYYRGNRPDVVQSIRLMGKTEGWTCIAGTDRCPRCSQAAAPKPVGNGAGGDQGDKQHA